MREIPFATFKIRVGDNESLGGGCAIGGEWREITTDEIRHHTDRNKLLNSLGSKSCKPSIPLQYTQLEKGDFFHLSTDGFWEWITEKEMQSFFMNSRRKEQPMSHVLALMEMHVRRLASGEQPDNDNYSGFNLHITEAKKNTFQWKKTIFLYYLKKIVLHIKIS